MVATTSDGSAAGDSSPGRWLGDLGRDLRHAVRGVRRSPGLAASVALMLALGLGVNIAMFGIVYGVLLRPLLYPDPAAIVRIGESLGSVGGSDMWLSNRSMPLLEESAGSFEQLAGYQEISARSASLDGASLSGANVSPSLFPLLGSRPQLGRLFTEEEAREGADRVVLLSYSVWTTSFGSDADVVGTLVDLDGEPHTVVGVRLREARRGGHRRGDGRVHRRAVGDRRSAVERGSGPAVVAARLGAHAERGKRAVRGRLPAAAVEPGAGGAG